MGACDRVLVAKEAVQVTVLADPVGMLPDEICPSSFSSFFLRDLFPADGRVALEVMTEGDGQCI